MSLLSTLSEATVVKWMAGVMIGMAVPTFFALVFKKRAPYGRYASEAEKGGYGFMMNGKLAWIVQEAPCVVIPVATLLFYTDAGVISARPNQVLLGMYLLHYIHRTCIFPLQLRGGKPTPFLVFLGALVFCLYNGYMQSATLARLQRYSDDWLSDPRFVIGAITFFTGMAINIHSDYTLIHLRKPGETGYKIPRGGAFELVSGANFFGEIVEWTGFAIACWSLPALAFAIFTFSNIAPRGAQHHQNYLEKFKDQYPKSRRAVIPFLW